jgi:acid phosphatase
VYRRLGAGPLLGDVLDRFAYAAKPSSPQKMALYGTHDTTVAAILSTLGVFDNRWPYFTSNITFELFKSQQHRGLLSFLRRDEYFVRMRYNHKVLSLPGTIDRFFVSLIVACKPSGKHREGDESLCTFAAFKEAIEKVRPEDWKSECRLLGRTLIFQANFQKQRKLQSIS